MKKFALSLAVALSFLIGHQGLTSGDMIGGSEPITIEVLELSAHQSEDIKQHNDPFAMYEEWKRTASPQQREQALKHAFEKFIAPQVLE